MTPASLKAPLRLGWNELGSPMKATKFESPKHGAVISVTPKEAKRLKGWFAK
jgi:hypothetical protein